MQRALSGELSVVVVAAGGSRRMGFDKLLAPLAGRTVLGHSLRAFLAMPEVRELVLVTSEERLREMEALVEELHLECSGERPEGDSVRCAVIQGGAERHLSVWSGLRALEAKECFVAVHDGARPLVTAGAVRGCLALARQTGAACCAAPIPDTVKRASREEASVSDGEAVRRAGGVPWVRGSVEREGLWAMQTPQIFEIRRLMEAYGALMAREVGVTDEVSAIQEAGGEVALFWNEDWNFKITFPRDLALAEAVLAARGGGFEGRGG